MKKIIALMIVAVLLAITGCSSSAVERKVNDESEFIIVENTNTWYMDA